MSTAMRRREGEQGYLLLWLVVVCFLLLLALSIAAPRVAKELERDREVESEHRAQEYVRAIQLYYAKTHNYPTSLDQLLGNGATGSTSVVTVKYLRQQYKDPLTHGDFRLIHLGEAKTEVKGFFGEPLQGLPVSNLGSAAGSQSNLGGGSSFGSSPAPGTFGAPVATAPAANPGAPPVAGPPSSTGAATPAGTADPSAGTTAAGTSGAGTTPFGGSGTSAGSFQGSKGGIVGVGSNAKGPGLVEWNGQANIEDWEFLYDPRVEALKAKVSLFGGSPASGSGSLGSGFAPANGIGTTGAAGTFGAPAAGIGGSPTSTIPGNSGGSAAGTGSVPQP